MNYEHNWKRSFGLREAGVYYAVAALLVLLALVSASMGRPSPLTFANLSNIVYQASLVAIMGVAMTTVLISGNFDLSVASVAALASAITIIFVDSLGLFPAAFIAIVVSCAIGLMNGAIVQFVGINAFIVTLGTLTAIRGLVLVLTNGRSLSSRDPNALAQMMSLEGGRVPIFTALLVIGVLLAITAAVLFLRRTKSGRGTTRSIRMAAAGIVCWVIAAIAGVNASVPAPVIYMAVFAFFVWVALTFTTIGRRLYAVGGNAEAARLSGINVTLYKLAAFVLSGGAAGVAGVLYASRFGAINPTALQGTELTVIAAAILGGTSLYGGSGSVTKTIAGALLLFTLTNGFNMLNIGANYQGLIEGVVVIAAAAIYTIGGSNPSRKRKAIGNDKDVVITAASVVPASVSGI
ncbi:ABC transporter permease [Rhizobium sp. Root1204]|uniref:ABC transporter permease n=1 Tax=Rhizobium sp. Root1204 TaxID=1736428 RepID=UPI0009E84569|nr:ABC transporter permease [Rhizobium sp. Root1204]